MAKEKTKIELQDERRQLQARAKAITDAARGETRMLNDGENKELAEIQLRLADINIELAARGAESRQQADRAEAPDNFSLRSTILNLTDRRSMTDETRRMDEIGRAALRESGATSVGSGVAIPIEARDSFTATGAAGTGSDLIDTTFMNILPPLRDRLVLARAGAHVLTGLRGNIDLPSYSGASAHWAGENDPAQDGGGKFSHKLLAPKRLTSKLLISRQLLIQDSLGVEGLLRSDLINAVASTLEATILGGHAHGDNKPDGLFTGFAGVPATMTWDAMVDMETAVDLDNALADNAAYIIHTRLYGKGKKTPKKEQGVLGFITDADGSINGYKTLRTNAMYSNASTNEAGDPVAATAWGAIFGNWADLLVCQWGALELIVDPITRAEDAFVKLIVHSYWDVAPRRDVAFNKMLLK